MIEVALERAAARRRDRVFRFGHPPFEGLGAGDVIRLLQLPGVYAQVAVGRIEKLLEVVEAERVRRRQCAEDTEPDALVNETIERQRPLDLSLASHRTKRRWHGAAAASVPAMLPCARVVALLR